MRTTSNPMMPTTFDLPYCEHRGYPTRDAPTRRHRVARAAFQARVSPTAPPDAGAIARHVSSGRHSGWNGQLIVIASTLGPARFPQVEGMAAGYPQTLGVKDHSMPLPIGRRGRGWRRAIRARRRPSAVWVMAPLPFDRRGRAVVVAFAIGGVTPTQERDPDGLRLTLGGRLAFCGSVRGCSRASRCQ